MSIATVRTNRFVIHMDIHTATRTAMGIGMSTTTNTQAIRDMSMRTVRIMAPMNMSMTGTRRNLTNTLMVDAVS
jgi:hypothetical protein